MTYTLVKDNHKVQICIKENDAYITEFVNGSVSTSKETVTPKEANRRVIELIHEGYKGRKTS